MKERIEFDSTKQNSYFQAKPTMQTKPFETQSFAKPFGTKAKEGLSYEVGDRVKHMKFGEGTVMQIVEGGRDYEVTVAFDNVGVKKMFATFARLQKV